MAGRKNRTVSIPRIDQAPVRIISDLSPCAAHKLFDRGESAFETEIVTRIGALEGCIDDCTWHVGGTGLGQNLTEGLADRWCIEDYGSDEAEGIIGVDRWERANGWGRCRVGC